MMSVESLTLTLALEALGSLVVLEALEVFL